jgi:hypothetical protein
MGVFHFKEGNFLAGFVFESGEYQIHSVTQFVIPRQVTFTKHCRPAFGKPGSCLTSVNLYWRTGEQHCLILVNVSGNLKFIRIDLFSGG